MTQVPRVDRSDQFLEKELEGRYRIVERLGEGGMATVYRAQQIAGGPDVAVKLLHDELIHDEAQRERFEREARALFGLDHPNILNVHDYGVHEGLPFLVMELLTGETLDKLVEDGPLPPEDAVGLVRQVLAGLSVAHAKGVLHRDIKSENVVVVTLPGGGRSAKLLDFGLVKFVDDDRWGDGRALTAFGEVFGTPAYMSPEQCTGEPAEASSDVYSIGVLLFELLTGDWPFMEESRAEMMRAHLMTPPPSLADTRPGLAPRPELAAVVDRAMAKDKKARFTDAAEMLAALEAVPSPVATVAGETSTSKEQPSYDLSAGTDPVMRPTLPLPVEKKTHPLVWIAVAGGAIGLLVIAVAVVIALVAL